jgi:hypothetical protein
MCFTFLRITEVKDRDDIPLLLKNKKEFKTGFDWIYVPMQLTDWPLVEMALLLIGLTYLFGKNQLWPSRERSIVF